MSPWLPKAEPISTVCGISVIMYLRDGKKPCGAAVRERSERKCERDSLPETKVSKKEGKDMLQVPKQRFPCSPRRRPW